MKTWIVAVAMGGAACTAAAPEDAWKPLAKPPGYAACEVDHGAGATAWIEWRDFDADGNVVRDAAGSINQFADVAVVDQDVVSTYRRDRWLTAETRDHAGTVLGRDRATYDDARGNLQRYERDYRGGAPDGVPDAVETHTYLDNGQLSRIDYDDDADGTVDRYETVTHDAYGCFAGAEYVSPTLHERLTYKVNPACNIIEIDHDTNADGTIDCVETQSYLQDIYPLRWHSCDGGDGVWTYDDQWRLWQYTQANSTDTYLYDCTGRPRP
jgi:hypothetical protein